MNFINNAADCSIKVFMDARFDNKLDRLIIEGNPTNVELYNALIEIETEYNDLCGDFPPELSQMNKVNKLVARNEAIKMYFFALDEMIRRIFNLLPANAFDEGAEYLERPKNAAIDIINKLKKFGVNIKWNDNIEDFKIQIKNARTREISKQVQLEEMTKELETMQKTSKTSKQVTKKEFYRLIHAVQALGFKVSESETNMFSFGVMCFDFFEMTKKQNGS